MTQFTRLSNEQKMEKEVHRLDPHPHTTLNNQFPVIIYWFSKTGSSGSSVKADLGTRTAPTQGLTDRLCRHP